MHTSYLGWIGADFRLIDAVLFPHELGGSDAGIPDDLASVAMQDDTLIPILMEV
ncbi:hypothetical protein BN2476_630042 [Paraburkholderia piptadeniae]|uniref:Uncharacterized protein n=1 Tax=Paraburkholderia piptadeniae TaxID=1701573 RepID=A0A1N7SLH7_9BURK|nr:hypothetical protein BN2476_630042 [Paraburkholderia piptadeniae]